MKTMTFLIGLQCCIPLLLPAQRFDLWIANRQLPSPNTMEFDLMIRSFDSGVVIPLKFVQAGYRFNPWFVRGGTLTGSYITGSSELETSFGKTWGFSYNPTQSVLNQSANIGSVCPGALISSEPRRIARFRVVNSVSWGCEDDSISFVTAGSGILRLAVVKYNSADCSDDNPSFITSFCNSFTIYPNASSLRSSASVLLPNNPCDTFYPIVVSASGGAAPYTGTDTFTSPPGYHSFLVTDARGCEVSTDAIITRRIYQDSFNDTACEKYLLPWGTIVVESGSYSQTYTSSSGCDSMVTAHINILNSSEGADTVQIWPQQLPFQWNNIICNTPGSYGTVLTSSSGCDSIVTLLLRVLDSCSPRSIISTAINDSICSGGSATLTVTGNLPYEGQWNWYAGGCGSGSLLGRGASIRVSPRSSTTYFARSQGGDCGTTSCASRTVFVKSRPSLPGPINGLSSGLCNTFDISYTVEPAASASLYTWYVPEGSSIKSGQGSQSVKVDFSARLSSNINTASNNICVKSSNECGTSACRNLSISLRPSAAGTISGPLVLLAGQTAEYSSSVFGCTGYSWSVPSDWRILSGQGSARIIVRAGSSNGYVKLVPSNACGQGGSGIRYINISASQARPVAEELISVYPNPASDKLFFRAGAILPDFIEITDMQGRIWRQIPWCEEMNLEGIPSGTYLVRIFVKDRPFLRRISILR